MVMSTILMKQESKACRRNRQEGSHQEKLVVEIDRDHTIEDLISSINLGIYENAKFKII